MKNNNQFIRQYDLDWIKVLATLTVFLYHCSMFFNPFDWHIKNNVINRSYIDFFSLFVGNWIMPIFFMISGISTYYALQKRNSQRFVKERLVRLGIPLLLGIFILSPPQVYIERITNNQFDGSFFKFFPHYFDGLYLEIGGTGNFAFFGHHLWYLLELLLFSMITLPFFLNVKKGVGHKAFGTFHYLVMPIPLMIVALTANNIVNLASWGIIFYLILFIYGYYFFSRESLREFVRRVGVFAGYLSAISTAGYIFWAMYIGFPMNVSLNWGIFMILRVILVWNVLFFILYLGDKYLNFINSTLKYTSEASMPFYVLHQPIIIMLGFFIYNLEWAVPVKVVFLVPVAFTIIMILYHFIIRRFNLLRVMFGLRIAKENKIMTEKIRTSLKN
ncbi:MULTISPECIES: acyltransferase family protein [Neobacillus]|uniref:Acyltransferase family protein n=1 Tax=Neobacillus rhizophilus TaxID=2833579 RepID=A0A942U7G8_9BACI|nr:MULTISPECIES: acyltransferase family protein [Neobacillus]MBS4214058.1 acyltransferase family protein [Neobacillus rhizophilus]MBU8917540.1 acyltransferase family protein [Bacillus sp. FJAT-29953]